MKAYPKYKKIEREKLKGDEHNFNYFVKDKSLIRMHEFNIGTITSDKFINVKYLKGKSLGNLEENFASKLKSGDTFLLCGQNAPVYKNKRYDFICKKIFQKKFFNSSMGGRSNGYL